MATIGFLASPHVCNENKLLDRRKTAKLEKLVSEPAACDLQAFLVFFQHPAWVYHTGKLIEEGFLLLK